MRWRSVKYTDRICHEFIKKIFLGSECWPEVTSHPKIHKHILKPVSIHKAFEKVYILSKIYKVLLQLLNLFWVLLWKIARPDFIFVQTPPAIPVLLVAHLVCWLRWSTLVIDWHNYGYTILNMSKKGHWTVFLYELYERVFGKGAKHNFCVSNAMKLDLAKKWRINATVLYDRPPHLFKPAELAQRHKFFLTEKFGQAPDPLLNAHTHLTAFTIKEKKKICLRNDRPALIVSSTSWTKDEDFDMLLDAMVEVDKTIQTQ